VVEWDRGERRYFFGEKEEGEENKKERERW